MLTIRERFILVWVLRTLNEYAATIRGADGAIPDKNIQEMQEARIRNLSDADKKEHINEIKNEMMLTESFLITSVDQHECPGDEKLV